MRGARLEPTMGSGWLGIIPADAGSTRTAHASSGTTQDHPRGCGEHYLRWNGEDDMPGSSPRMRGARSSTLAQLWIVRIIPADAGSTFWLYITLSLTKDHPRGCGEHLTICFSSRHVGGSSPRMRGAPLMAIYGPPGSRIIPADAGSTNTGTCTDTGSTDHPRGCGEHSDLLLDLS